MSDTELISPERAKEIKRAAARHAGMMILVSVGEWEPQKYAPHDARNDAEQELLIEEVERIGNEIKARALVGTSQWCSYCNLPFRVKADGTVGHHLGMDRSGFSSGERCPGVGKPPRIP
ncbi:hypothetical protein RKD48_006637 [Streptomyces ambofaciens]